MSFLRTVSTRRLLALMLGALLAVGGGTAIALAATSGGPTPPAKPLANAVHDALNAPHVQALSARVTFTNHLLGSSAVEGGNPILLGATGRVWFSKGHGARLELQGSNGDSQIVVKGNDFSIYDATSNAAYKGRLPQHAQSGAADKQDSPPSLSQVQDELNRLMQHANVSGATPDNVGGQQAYTVRLEPKNNGGLVGGAALAWDAVRGVPLRAAIYARGSNSPVLELAADHISYGSVPSSTFDVAPPANAKVVNVTPPDKASGSGGADHPDRKPVTGVGPVAKALPFTLSAPDTLAGMQRSEVRLLDFKGSPAALVTYGKGLGGIAVVERQDKAGQSNTGPLTIPSVTINGVKAQELDTALGSLIQFKRGDVTFTVLGSVTPDTAKAAASGL